jgi:sec-independent protein translocase protein TatA
MGSICGTCEGESAIQLAFFSGGIGAWEWVIILVIMLLLFGRRLPDVMRNLGSSAREFRKGLEDGKGAVSMQEPSGTEEASATEPAASKVSNDESQTKQEA